MKTLEDYANEVFPFTLIASTFDGITTSPHEFRAMFRDNRPPRVWYAYDVIIHSYYRVEFIVYNMRDTFYGGIGREVARFEVEAREPKDTAIVKGYVDKRLKQLASDYHDHLARLERERLVQASADALRRLS